MNDQQNILARSPANQPIYRRRLVKPDGRDVMLYGYHPHDEKPAEDMLDGGPKKSELRWHPLRREWSVYAAGRQNRTFKPSASDDPLAPTRTNGPATEIPFSDFELAIFENRFPSFSANPGAAGKAPSGLKTAAATGRCEVVVYTPEGTGSLATLGAERRIMLVHAWIDRYQDLFNAGAAFVLPFENRGEEVGVTLLHPHGQIYALPVIPSVQLSAAKTFADGYDFAGHMKDWMPEYGIKSEGGMNSFAPPFARFPYEIWIAPQAKRNNLWDFTDEELEAFANQLGDMTARYDQFFGRECAYMLSLHGAPAPCDNHGQHENWHFTAQFYPLLRSADKVKYLASVEQSTNLFTVDVQPEETAKLFRTIKTAI